MKILFLMVARGGSKGIAGKNLQKIASIPLVGWKAIAARRSRHCDRLILSTDSPKIRDAARRFGVETPFLRPKHLATDTAKTADVILHAMRWIEREGRPLPDAIMLLEPSSPFARASDYDRAVALMKRHKADVVLGVRRMEIAGRFVGPMERGGRLTRLVRKIGAASRQRRQDFVPEFTPNGAVYLFNWDYFKKHRSLYADGRRAYGMLMDDWHSLEIDEPADLEWARYLVAKGYIDVREWKTRGKK